METACFFAGFPTFRTYGIGGHLGIDLRYYIDEQHPENRKTSRKEIPRLGKHRKEPDFGTKYPEVMGSVSTSEHAADAEKWIALMKDCHPFDYSHNIQ